jgi:iron complex transport system ATP-binding protein
VREQVGWPGPRWNETVSGSPLKTNAIELRNIGVVRNQQPILQDVSLTIGRGACCAILGPNGSGKSALMAVLSGYLWPSAGTVCIDGAMLGRVSLDEVRQSIGLIEPSRAPKFDDWMTVREVAATGLFGTIMLPLHEDLTESQWRRVDAELASIGLQALATHRYGDLSSGEQMKTLLARAMISNARILLLDEPTVGLDIGSRAACVDVLDRLAARSDPPTIVIVSHHLDELPHAVGHVLLMKAGRVFAQGTPETMLTSSNLSELFGCRIEVFRNDGRFVASARAGKE